MKKYKRIILIITSFLLFYFSGFTGGYLYIKNVKQLESKGIQESNKLEVVEVKLADLSGEKINAEEDELKLEKIHRYNKLKEKKEINKKIAYLTFDDGPSGDITPEILRILEKNEVKATFFVIGKMAEEHKELLKLEFELGHAIGNHTYSHNMSQIYRNIEFFKADVAKCDEVIKSILGKDYITGLFRFPGGSFEEYKDTFKQYIKGMSKKYYDWNCLNGDAEDHGLTKERLIKRFKETFGGEDRIILLMHDTYGKKSTVEALPYIIKDLKEKGYIFKTLDEYDD